jgi:cytochrome c553
VYFGGTQRKTIGLLAVGLGKRFSLPAVFELSMPDQEFWSMKHTLTRSFLAALALAIPLTAPSSAQAEPDMERGKALNRQCALCHGFHAQGIIGGKYPRLAGLPDYYLLEMMEKYKAGILEYPAMTVVGGMRNLSKQDLESLAAFIAEIDLAEVAPLDIPTAPGDVEEGEDLYKGDCKTCHGRKGEGKARKESPPLRGQYTEYLARQIEMFKKRERVHADDEEDETFVEEDGTEVYSDQELADILAFISTLDDE